MSVRKHYVIIGNRRHGYTLRPSRRVTVLVCKSADIDARFPNDEIPRILAELPQRILEQRQREAREQQSEVLRFRVTPTEKQRVEQRAYEAGFDTVSAYLRAVALEEARAHEET